MKKWWIVILVLLLAIIVIVGGIYYFSNYDTENKINSLNSWCEQTSCAPYKEDCNHWRLVNYAPYKHCHYKVLDISKLNDIDLCKKIERKDLATYCIALVISKNPNFDLENFVDGNRTLKAISHITNFNQLLYIEEEKYVIKGDCSYMHNINSCNSTIWKEE